MLIRENPEIKSFKISARSDSVLRNKDMLETLLKMGCNSIEIGVESYSDQQLKRYNKKVTAQENIDCYKILYKLSKQYNFRLIHELIPFDPWVTKQDLTKTVDFYINNNFDYLELEPWLFTKLILYPNTKLRFLAEKDHIISKDNHEELPHWDFVEEDVACIYSSMQKYKHIFLPQIESLRQVINKLLASETLILNRKLICLSIQKKLSKITLVFFHNLLEQQTIQDLPSCLLQISNTIKQYSEKINEIKENREYKNEQ